MADELIILQTELFERLQKAERNYKKTPKERIKQAYIETKLQTLEELWQEFKSGHNKIVIAVTPAKKATLNYFIEDTYDIFEELYTSYKSTLKTAIQTFSKGDGQHKSHESVSQTTEVKLPRIQLPTFTGKYDEWQSFYDMFVSLIHDNVTLSGVQKLHYLKANLSGEPEKLLRNFATTEQNYEEAWKLLTKRYNNIRYNTNAILTNLFTQKQITNPSSNSVKQLLDTTTSCLKSLNNLEIKTQECDVFIVYLVVSKLDPESHRLWEQKLSALSDKLPTWSQLVDFLECRFRSLEMIDAGKHTTKLSPLTERAKHTNKTKSFHSAVQEEPKKYTNAKCIMCDGQHYLYHCKLFEQQPTTERVQFIQKHQLCFNCMSPNHVVHKCRQSACCRKCGRRHHTMLHYENRESLVEDKTKEKSNTHSQNQNEKTNPPIAHTSNNETRIVANFSSGELHSYSVILATAVINAHSRQGERYLIRALLDQGSQASFISESTVQLLKLKRIPVNGLVSGLGEGHTRVKYMVSLKLESRHNPEFIHNVNAYVLSTLTSLLPSESIESSQWLELESLPLADPDFAKPAKIDVLLGAEVYSEILLNNMIKNSKGNLIAQNTVFGWVISGRVLRDDAANNRVVSMHAQMRDDDWLKHFWEIEAEPNSVKRILTKEEMRCEKYYEETTVRNENGRFIVRLPFKDEKQECTNGESKQIAMRRLLFLEKQLNKNPNLRREYERVIGEYSTLNHMEPVQQHEIDYPRAVYLPHHPVVREDKETTQVRVVMNASSKGTNGVSLNDDLLVGPRLQQDLRHILMRWREHRICIVADIIKMYRQVLLHKDDAEFQRILWRSDASLPIQHFRLITLTFGTACAPYLAVKTLQTLATVESSRYPKASEITKTDYFVDDLMTGCTTETEAIEIYNEMNQLMNSGGFNLQKWSSNSDQLLQYIGKDKHNEEQTIPIKSDTNMKVLGIKWNRQTDKFEYAITLPEPKEPITKRQILSDIARIYDPLGWIAPVVICAKIIMQKVWKNQLDWDEELTDDLLHVWLRFRYDLEDVKNITVSRWIQCKRDCSKELHAFSDASTAGYAAAVYIRVVDEQGNINVSLVSAKTKVAPIDKEVSIPRLELCGAVLAAKLLSEISQVMDIRKEALFGWTDSTIVLAWLKGGPSRWNTFVSNRVSEILTIIEYEQWGHVATEANPADCASRGLRPAHLQTHTLWWNGPSWLSEPRVERDKENVPETHEEEKIKTFNIVSGKNEEFEWTKFSKLSKMLRVISYCKRFLSLKKPKEERENRTNYITPDEIKKTLEGCIKQAQEFEFEEEIKSIKSKGHVPKKSVLHTLCPFLDKNGILRVGGRIEKAHASYDKRHPIIIPAKSHLTQLLIADAHNKTLHGGPQIMQNFLRSTYWILRARDQTKKYFRQCVTCLRYSKANSAPLMGQLPEVRLKPSKPFKATGVDYAGPINIRFSPGRGSKSYKGYICIFICMVTRAMHIEAVSDLTTKGFIAAFRRFTARRGHCQDIYSDNGTNFVGAERELRDMFNTANSKLHNEVAQAVTHENTNWHFIPPHAPNFGGLWEAGVRSIKTHLKKVIGDSTLTYEELSTVLSQVEACLNSRPISLLSDDPDDPLPLTPGHFLVGEPLLNVTDENFSNCNISNLERWRLVQKMVHDIWNRWSNEYLTNLSKRYKWNVNKPEPNVGDIVIIRDDNIPPAKWILGKIIVKHVGLDNVTRVVTVKTKNNTLKRPLSKVIILEK